MSNTIDFDLPNLHKWHSQATSAAGAHSHTPAVWTGVHTHSQTINNYDNWSDKLRMEFFIEFLMSNEEVYGRIGFETYNANLARMFAEHLGISLERATEITFEEARLILKAKELS